MNWFNFVTSESYFIPTNNKSAIFYCLTPPCQLLSLTSLLHSPMTWVIFSHDNVCSPFKRRNKTCQFWARMSFFKWTDQVTLCLRGAYNHQVVSHADESVVVTGGNNILAGGHPSKARAGSFRSKLTHPESHQKTPHASSMSMRINTRDETPRVAAMVFGLPWSCCDQNSDKGVDNYRKFLFEQLWDVSLSFPPLMLLCFKGMKQLPTPAPFI